MVVFDDCRRLIVLVIAHQHRCSRQHTALWRDSSRLFPSAQVDVALDGDELIQRSREILGNVLKGGQNRKIERLLGRPVIYSDLGSDVFGGIEASGVKRQEIVQGDGAE